MTNQPLPNPDSSNEKELQMLLQVSHNRPLSDAELREFVLLIKKLGTKKAEKLKWLSKLIDVIQKSGKLTKLSTLMSRRGYYYADAKLEDVYADALNETFLYISQNIDNYDPKKHVMAWANQTLYWEFQTAFNRVYRNKGNEVNRQATSLDALLNYNFDVPASESFDENEEYCGSYLRVLQLDLEGLLSSIKLRYTNQVTKEKGFLSLRSILLMLANGLSRMDIVRRFHVAQASLYSFIKRQRQKEQIRNYFDKYAGS